MELRKTIENLLQLHSHEEDWREKALTLVASDEKIILHLEIVQQAMDLANTLRQLPTDDEDLKVIQLFGMRMFNAFGSSFKLAMSGYSQNSALIMRDILETIFLLDMFRSDRGLISQWRLTDDGKQNRKFRPVHVRTFLDKRDGYVKMKRAERYKVFSELAGHPTMKSDYMLRHQKDGDAFIGPFVKDHMLQAVLTEMGTLAIEASEYLDAFFPESWESVKSARSHYLLQRKRWFKKFLSK
jgi:uncharacterized protein YlaN (UPF0358 family)